MVEKKWIEDELKTQKENYNKLIEQKAQAEAMIQQTIGVINTLQAMMNKFDDKEKKKK